MQIQANPLRPLCIQLIESSSRFGFTPVITLERGLRLHDAFFQHLFRELYEQLGDREIRCEVLYDPSRWIRTQLDHRLAKRIATNAESACELPGRQAAVESRVIPSRPAGKNRLFVFALTFTIIPLPNWSKAFHLVTKPANLDDIQIVAA